MTIRPPILLIDGLNDPDEATWVDFYDTVESICWYLEPWFVDEPHVTLDAAGTRLRLVPTEHLDLEETPEPQRPDIVRKFVIKDIREMADDRWAPAERIPTDLDSVPLETLWGIYREGTAWYKANPPPRRSLMDVIKGLFAKRQAPS